MPRLLKSLTLLAVTFMIVSNVVSAHRLENVRGHIGQSTHAIANEYIVRLKDATPPKTVEALAKRLAYLHHAELVHVYEYAIKGFAARMDQREALALSLDPRVESVAEDGEVAVPAAISQPVGWDVYSNNWGLDRIDQRSFPLDRLFTYTNTGKGVNVYVLDSGVMPTHAEFGGRVVQAVNIVNDFYNPQGWTCNGHATHVAGIIGGKTYGVAKEAKLYSVRVLTCSGFSFSSDILAGIDRIARNAVKPAVVNMSFTSEYWACTTGANGQPSCVPAQDQVDVLAAVQSLIDSGITCVVGAGNTKVGDAAQPAENYSPARLPAAITVGATDIYDNRISWTSYGNNIDIFAPGDFITSAWTSSPTATNTISGTSMATAFVTGAVAQYLQTHPSASPAEVREFIVRNATYDQVQNAGYGAINALLYSRQ